LTLDLVQHPRPFRRRQRPQVRLGPLREYDLETHLLFRQGFLKFGLELRAFPRRSAAFHAAQLLPDRFLNGLTTALEDMLMDQSIQFAHKLFVQCNSYFRFAHVHSPIGITVCHTYDDAAIYPFWLIRFSRV
jgi:hypothetical protein